jgi:hypothetical protein
MAALPRDRPGPGKEPPGPLAGRLAFLAGKPSAQAGIPSASTKYTPARDGRTRSRRCTVRVCSRTSSTSPNGRCWVNSPGDQARRRPRSRNQNWVLCAVHGPSGAIAGRAESLARRACPVVAGLEAGHSTWHRGCISEVRAVQIAAKAAEGDFDVSYLDRLGGAVEEFSAATAANPGDPEGLNVRSRREPKSDALRHAADPMLLAAQLLLGDEWVG